METLRGGIISYAEDYIGKEEIKGNKGFKDKEFEAKMRSIGFVTGYAWCCLFVELCWTEAYQDFGKSIKTIEDEFSAGTVRTYRHFKSIGWTSQLPKPGDCVIWQKYKNGESTQQGHAAVVLEVHKDYIITSEGNTNDVGGREGYIVAKKKRKIDFTNDNGLRMLGFIKPK
jgi:hypothetical protein